MSELNFRKCFYCVVFWSSYYKRYEVIKTFDNYDDAKVFAFSGEENANYEYLMIHKRYLKKDKLGVLKHEYNFAKGIL